MNAPARCQTRSGRYQCKYAHGHDGQCEAEDKAVFSFGPYTDSYRGRAYLRGALDVSRDEQLDHIGDSVGVKRDSSEADEKYRERIWGKR